MEDKSKTMVKAQCDSVGMLLRVLFWGFAAFVLAAAAAGLWMAFCPEGEFAVNLPDTGGGLAGFAFFRGGWELDLPRNLLRAEAAGAPKTVYLLGYLFFWIGWLLKLGILWQIRSIFKNIDTEAAPFAEKNCRALFWVGVLIVAIGTVRSAGMPAAFRLAALGGGQSVAALGGEWWGCLLAGGVVFCLSYVFRYGAALQKLSDETL